METESGQVPHSVDHIVRDACQYHYHQVIEALIQRRGAGVSDRRPSWLKLRPSDWLSFPAADIRRINQLPNAKLEIEATFFGFYGVDAPLPQYFLEDVTYQDEVGQRIQSFLDIFNDQAYWLLHIGWRKFRLMQEAGDANLFMRLASSLTGNYFQRSSLQVPMPGAMASPCRSAAGIETVLRDALSLPELDVDDTILTQVAVDEELTLDGSQALGKDTLLGRHMNVLGQKIAVKTGVVQADKGQSLQPDGELGQELSALLDQYLPRGVTYEVRITLPASQHPPMRLGNANVRLGQPMALGEDTQNDCELTFSRQQYQHATENNTGVALAA